MAVLLRASNDWQYHIDEISNQADKCAGVKDVILLAFEVHLAVLYLEKF